MTWPSYTTLEKFYTTLEKLELKTALPYSDLICLFVCIEVMWADVLPDCSIFVCLLVSLSLSPNLSFSWAEAKEASNSSQFFLFCFYNHRTTTSRQPRKLKFDMQAYFNPTKRNMK